MLFINSRQSPSRALQAFIVEIDKLNIKLIRKYKGTNRQNNFVKETQTWKPYTILKLVRNQVNVVLSKDSI